MILTIAIPTYNRPEQVTKTVLKLCPQLNTDTTVLVLDNCSNTDIRAHLQNAVRCEVLNKIKVVRHKINIGADANFARCFELCETPYIWVLGDDDEIEPNAVDLIFKSIRKYQDLDWIGINFRTNCMNVERRDSIFISGTKELSEKLDHFGNWLFISSTVYKTREYCKHLHYGMYGAYSMCSQIFPALLSISEGKTFILSNEYLVSNVPEEAHQKWSNYQLTLGLSAILEARIGFKQDEYRSFGKKFSDLLDTVYPGDTFFSILKSVQTNIDLIDNYHLFIYKHLFQKTIEFRDKRLTHYFQYAVCLFLMKNKWLLKILLSVFPAIAKKASAAVPFNLFTR